MSTDLALVNELPIAPAKFATPEALSKLTSTGFLQRIQLMGGNSEIVKEGRFPIGHFALISGKTHEDLTSEFTAAVLAWRPRAMQFQPEVVSYFDPETDAFKKVVDRADNEPQSNCGYGPEFLLWLPDYEKFGLFFCSNITARNEAPNIAAFMRKACTIRSELIKTKKYVWHGPRVAKCDLEIKLPDLELLRETVTKFCSPSSSEVEQAEPETRAM